MRLKTGKGMLKSYPTIDFYEDIVSRVTVFNKYKWQRISVIQVQCLPRKKFGSAVCEQRDR